MQGEAAVGTGLPVGKPTAHAWNTGICECVSDHQGFADAVCCRYCDLGYQSGRVFSGKPQQMEWIPCTVALLADALCFYGFAGCILQCMLRRNIVRKYHINESGCVQFLYSVACPFCAMCQQRRELKVQYSPYGGVCEDEPTPDECMHPQTFTSPSHEVSVNPIAQPPQLVQQGQPVYPAQPTFAPQARPNSMHYQSMHGFSPRENRQPKQV